MKVIFENGRPVPEADGLKSRGTPKYPDDQRKLNMDTSPIMHVGAWALQVKAEEYRKRIKRRENEQYVKDLLASLDFS